MRTLYEKITRLECRGHRVSLYTFTTGETDFLPSPVPSKDRFVQELNFTGAARCWNYLRASRETADAINRSDADVVWVDKCRYFGSPPLIRFLKKPTVFYAHEPLGLREYAVLAGGTDGEKPSGALASRFAGLSFSKAFQKIPALPERVFIKWQDRKSILSARRVLTSSHFAARWLRRVYGVEPVVCYQAVDADFFTPDPGVPKENQLLSVGRLEPRKGHLFSLRAIAKIPLECRPRFLIVCDDADFDYRAQLEKEAKERAVNLCLIRRPSQETLRDLYRRSRLVLCASIHEPFGLVPLEAMACGTAVIAVLEGGFQETVEDGRTGFLLQRDERIWAGQITECLSDLEQTRWMGLEGRRHVLSRWTWGTSVERIREEVEKIP